MALITVDMFGNKQDKVEVAIKRLKTFEPCEGYYVADSGGKDSCAAKDSNFYEIELARDYGCRFRSAVPMG